MTTFLSTRLFQSDFKDWRVFKLLLTLFIDKPISSCARVIGLSLVKDWVFSRLYSRGHGDNVQYFWTRTRYYGQQESRSWGGEENSSLRFFYHNDCFRINGCFSIRTFLRPLDKLKPCCSPNMAIFLVEPRFYGLLFQKFADRAQSSSIKAINITGAVLNRFPPNTRHEPYLAILRCHGLQGQ